MVRFKKDQEVEFSCICEGIGDTEQHKILNTVEEMYGKGRAFSHMFLAPGHSIGYHRHVGDNEAYYILSGNGLYNDNGTPVRVYPGDTMICNEGECHGILNDTDEPLEFIVLVLY